MSTLGNSKEREAAMLLSRETELDWRESEEKEEDTVFLLFYWPFF